MQGDLVFRIGHSPDPDDAFMFHALTTGALDTPGRRYVHELHDIENLNRHAQEGKFEVRTIRSKNHSGTTIHEIQRGLKEIADHFKNPITPIGLHD